MAMSFLQRNVGMLLLTLLLFLGSSINSTEGIRGGGSGIAGNDFIRESCKATLYRSLCLRSLSNYSSEIKTSHQLLAKTALMVTLDAAKDVSSFLLKYSCNNKTRPSEVNPIGDCKELMRDVVDKVSKSIADMDQIKEDKNFCFQISNIQTLVSAAMTDENTCAEDLAENSVNRKEKTLVNKKMENLKKLTSNALCLVNSYASHHQV